MKIHITIALLAALALFSSAYAAEDPFLSGYNKAMAEAMERIRKQHLDNQLGEAIKRRDSKVMQIMDSVVGAYSDHEMPVQLEALNSVREYVGQNLGVSSQRFDELLFDIVRIHGNKGNLMIYDVLKQDRPDGSRGMYYDPKWGVKLDVAKAESFDVFEQKHSKDKKERLDRLMLPVFQELYIGDPKKAREMFDAVLASGLIDSASDLLYWSREFNQGEARIYERKLGVPSRVR